MIRINEVIDTEELVRIEEEEFFVQNQQRARHPQPARTGDDEEIDIKIIDERQLNVYKLAKILYDEGNYEEALQIIKKLERQTLNNTLYLQTTWARLYLEIVLGKS